MSEIKCCLNASEFERLKEEVKDLRAAQIDTKVDIATIKNDFDYMKENLSAIRKIVESIADEPKRAWDSVKKQALTFIVGGALIGFVIYAVMLGTSMADKMK